MHFAHEIAASMRADEHYEVDALRGRLDLCAAGEALVEAAGAGAAAHGGPRERLERVRRALVARELMRRDVHYVVEDDRVVIVDEATGRRMPDRAWREGLHAAVERKENVPVRASRKNVARTLFVRFFRRYARLAGMTGTAWRRVASCTCSTEWRPCASPRIGPASASRHRRVCSRATRARGARSSPRSARCTPRDGHCSSGRAASSAVCTSRTCSPRRRFRTRC